MEFKSYQKISEHIQQEIISGKYVLGASLPSVRDLAIVYGVSPQTISKSIALLAEKGYVKTRRGSGSIVIFEKIPKAEKSVCMLVDNERNLVLNDNENIAAYHSKDIYLSFLLQMNNLSLKSQILMYEKDTQKCNPELCLELEAAGAVFVQGTLPECYFLFLENIKKPVVLINREIPNYIKSGYWGSVRIGNKGLVEGINYLKSLGHINILFPCPSYVSDMTVFKERYDKTHKAIQSTFGKKPFSLEIFNFTDSLHKNIEKLESYIKQGYTASFGFNDIAALEMSQLLDMLGLKIPEDFSLVGFDDIFAAQLSTPPLTTIKVPRSSMIGEAFKILDKLHEAQKENYDILRITEKIESTFVIRGSSFMRS
ncbi:GntR family transcriptional regulator [Thiospirochaeta perfilievii]|uniref:GntR family transcriptional regulator n=1 Tax=Thiospirochaeta perfilievii TaxID=252967 RepID=A0A5C1QB61_9SPIO|nr:LacI family DNA-binding transcriptional regulator [Thiospirochaeta perfilievii]QEN04290.1 GntR family transcriptional regulator [Thiospirochaeta perfilievii]